MPNPAESPFSLLGVEPRFDLDVRRLRIAWMQRAAVAHPDAAGAVEASTSVNDAYRLLLDPIERARALLAVLQAPSVDERRLPEGFLMEMVELRERADQETEEGRTGLLAEARERREAALSEIGSIFEGTRRAVGQGTTLGPPSAEDTQAIHVQLNVVRAFDRMLEQLEREGSS